MSDTAQSPWEYHGLPDECPECGEREDLSAAIHRMDRELRATTATVECDECGNEWPWGTRKDEQDE